MKKPGTSTEVVFYWKKSYFLCAKSTDVRLFTLLHFYFKSTKITKIARELIVHYSIILFIETENLCTVTGNTFLFLLCQTTDSPGGPCNPERQIFRIQ